MGVIKIDKKKYPTLRFPEFTDDWEQCKFRDFTKISQGLQIAISERFTEPKEDRLFYITNEFLNPNSSVVYYIQDAPKSVIANKKDILMTRTGNTGKVVTGVYGAFHNNFFKISYDESKVNHLYLFYLLNSNYVQNEIRIGAGSSTIPDLKHPNFYRIKVKIPEFSEQTKIGNFFKQLDDTIALHQSKLDLLKEQKKGFLQKMFPKNGEKVPELRFWEFTDDWELRKLGELAIFSKGNGYTKNDLTEKGNPIVLYGRLYTKYETVINEVDTFVEMKDKSVVSQGNEVVVPASGETAEDISRASVVGTKGLILGGDLNIIKLNNEINSIFLALTISNGTQQKEMIKRAQGKSVVHLHNSDLKQLNLLYPNFEEQSKIGSFFKQFDEAIALHQRKLDMLKEQKKSFLQKMFA
ncbi:restriction endonuclease subunit S [Enterococcus avium]|uniref:Restriction endonuclease subunit S n=1 Tax=Enterococcus avium TaxID=33945 RepID=A0AAW8RYC6_ENTAV|nr:restriction endonuclease subunit S [Enterococcus avium]MDT2404833.1 restriction endonuclease subunit S [Enterococcus avium]MDT2434269.1 restriction endonuclease subunit S [Enterococcus avium]MDT2467900.1 restriction endonuclease subunit S [Enterococcus avium]MDT2507273.1 restriction endonuclease subunit S [Enterococcus avium]